MLYLLIMTIAGNIMFFLYFLMSRILGIHWLCRQRYFLLKVVLVYFLVPMAPLKDLYMVVIVRAGGLVEAGEKRLRQGASRINNLLVKNPVGLTYPNYKMIIQIGIFLVFLVGATVVLIKRIRRYIRLRRMVQQQIRFSESIRSELYQMLDALKKEYRIRRDVELCILPNAMHCTMGIFRPVIILGEIPKEERATEYILRHELIHIKKHDFLFRIIMEFVVCLHWFNPFKWVIEREFEYVLELDCDERAMWNADEEERRYYANLLLSQTGTISVGKWASSLAKKTILKRERIKSIMNKKIPNKIAKIATTVLMGVVIFSSSLTALAYQGVDQAETKSSGFEELDYTEAALFVPDEINNVFRPDDEIIYDEQFTDEDGNVYPVTEEGSFYGVCSHNLVHGTIEKHARHLNGSCTVKVYDGYRCSICGYIYIGDLLNVIDFLHCPH